ncbi:sporulation protein, partial [Brevibacillus brevis]|uniref:Spo0B C-terminal domain-containing protein n=3 Tax=Bacilli TaxID=91061 RepID=UPI001F5B2B0D
HLKRIAQMAMQESMVARLNSSLLSVFFLTFNALNNELLLEVDVCNHVDLTRVVLNEQDLFQLVSEILCTVNDHVDQSGYEAASMQVSLQMDECGVHFRFDLAGVLRASGMEELEKLIRKSEQSTVEVTEWIHTEEEWVLKLVVPFAE